MDVTLKVPKFLGYCCLEMVGMLAAGDAAELLPSYSDAPGHPKDSMPFQFVVILQLSISTATAR